MGSGERRERVEVPPLTSLSPSLSLSLCIPFLFSSSSRFTLFINFHHHIIVIFFFASTSPPSIITLDEEKKGRALSAGTIIITHIVYRIREHNCHGRGPGYTNLFKYNFFFRFNRFFSEISRWFFPIKSFLTLAYSSRVNPSSFASRFICMS